MNAVLKEQERGRKNGDWGLKVRADHLRDAEQLMSLSQEMAELAVDFRERGVVGFDLAGEEGGFPPKKHHRMRSRYIQRENFAITERSLPEAFGKESIWQAIRWCQRALPWCAPATDQDIELDSHDPTKIVRMGYLAQYILDKRIPLEICLSSSVDARDAAENIQTHPFICYRIPEV